MEACPCPSAASGGHRLMQAGCDELPDTCPSLGCAEEAAGSTALHLLAECVASPPPNPEPDPRVAALTKPGS